MPRHSRKASGVILGELCAYIAGTLFGNGVQLRGFDNLDAAVDYVQGKLRVPRDEVLIVTLDECEDAVRDVRNRA